VTQLQSTSVPVRAGHERQLLDRRSARNAVRSAISAGMIPKAATLHCVDCGEMAAEWDHYLGYTPEHHMHVLPRCRSCHQKQKKSSYQIVRHSKNTLTARVDRQIERAPWKEAVIEVVIERCNGRKVVRFDYF
jgi:hypothetical protein